MHRILRLDPMHGNRRGQGSSEHLTMLAAVLAVALLAIILVSGGAFSGGSVSESEQYWTTTGPVSIREQAQRGGTLFLTLFNREPSWLAIDSITVGNVTSQVNTRLNSGGSATISISGLEPCSSSKDSYSYPASIRFSSLDLPNQVKTGAKPLVGKCEGP